MNKDKSGDRIIIEIGKMFENETGTAYKAEGTNTLDLNDAQLDKLEQIKESEE
jgi:hypothetical protein